MLTTINFCDTLWSCQTNIFYLLAYINLERTPVSFGPGVFLFYGGILYE
nr:MAG TPA: hypothetical protein [Caudoviricetes sp.]